MLAIAPTLRRPVFDGCKVTSLNSAGGIHIGFVKPEMRSKKKKVERPEFDLTPRVSSLALHAAEVVARRKSTAAFNSARVATESRAAAGLVSVSTTLTESIPSPKWFVSPTQMWSDAVIEIDPAKARVTRLRKGLGVGAKRLHNMYKGKQNHCLVTLTYRGDNRNWRPEHVSTYLACVKRWYARQTGSKGLRYAWVAELQQRGVIHYHIVFWLKKGLTMPKADKQGWWPHGMTNTKRATAPIAYLMKYVSKIDSKNVGSFPHGARIFGLGGLDKTGRDCKRWVLWPAYLQGNAAAGDNFKPAAGGGYTNADTGEHFCAEFAPTGSGFKHFVRVHRHPRVVDASGPFSWLSTSNTVH